MERAISRQNGVVVKRNEFIKAGFNLSVNEYRLINLCIAKIDSIKDMPPSITLDKDTILSIFPVMKSNYYRDISKLVSRLYERNIGFIIDNDEVHRNIRWLQEEAHFKNGSIEIVFSNRIAKYISNIDRNGFTKCKIENISSFNSFYAVRIYEYMKMYTDFQKIKKKKEKIRLTFKELREMFQLENKYLVNGKPNDKEIKRNVIDMAVREINKKHNLITNVCAYYQGRRVIGVDIEYVTHVFCTKTTNYSINESQINDDSQIDYKGIYNQLSLDGDIGYTEYEKRIDESLKRERMLKEPQEHI